MKLPRIKLSTDSKKALWGGAIAASIIAVGVFYLGNIGQHEAKVLLSKSIPGFNMLCNTVVLASATILALLLTLLGISHQSESRLNADHYKQVGLLARSNAIIFIAAIILFQFSNIPMTEANNFPKDWFASLYWITLILILTSLLCGGIVAVILLLYNIVVNIIQIVGLGMSDHPFVDSDSE